jgi:acyl carrier protein
VATPYGILTGYLTDHFGVDPETINEHRTFAELELDSLAVVELAVLLEDGLGILLPDDASAFSPDLTLAEALRYLEQLRAESAAAISGGDAGEGVGRGVDGGAGGGAGAVR